MSAPLTLACLWVLAATVTAMLPMRRQRWPGLALLIAAPVLILWLSLAHGWWVGAVALAGFLSMVRRPLVYLGRRALGLPVSLPAELDSPPEGKA